MSRRPVDPTWRPYLRVTSQEEVDEEQREAREASDRWRAGQIAAEQARVDAALANGATFIVNLKGDDGATVHTLGCQHARSKLDRQATWEEWSARANGAPPSIDVLHRVEVEAIRRYALCKACVPDVTPRRTAKADSIFAQSLHARHVGQRVVCEDGTDLGVLEGIEQVIVIRTDTGRHVIPARERVALRDAQG